MRSRTSSLSQCFVFFFLFVVVTVNAQYIHNSRCLPNRYGPDCGPECNAFTIMPDGWCTLCPEFSTSLAGSLDILNCHCNQGFMREYYTVTLPVPSPQFQIPFVTLFRCVPISSGHVCEENFYQTSTVCQKCPDYSTADKGSDKLEQCTCIAGYRADKYINAFGIESFQCLQCPSGKYAIHGVYTNPDSQTCFACPLGSSSPSGSTLKDCLCSSGSIKQDGVCTQCSTGKYSDGTGTECWKCPEHSTSGIGWDRCKCEAGFSGYDWRQCKPCPADTYNYFNQGEECKPCPENTTSPAMSIARGQCVCKAGFQKEDTASLECTFCLKGKYKNVSGNQLCSNCPSNKISPEGSTNVTACQCNAGFSGISANGSCVTCAAGTYKTVVSSGPCTNCSAEEPMMDVSRQTQRAQICQQCKPGTYQNTSSKDASCVNCRANSTSLGGSRSQTDCLCNAGFIGDPNECIKCPSGWYPERNDSVLCKAISGIAFFNPTTKREYFCTQEDYDQAYEWKNGILAIIVSQDSDYCVHNFICTACCSTCRSLFGRCNQRPHECRECPVNSHSTLDTCTCNAGFAGPNGWNCNACGPGKYSVGEQLFCSCNAGTYGPSGGDCTSCPSGKFSIGGQTSCTECQAGTYSMTAQTTCTICPVNSYSPNPGAAIDGCTCNAGFEGTGGTCLPCKAGKYKDTRGSACSTCPPNTTSQIGSMAKIECQCSAGYTCSDVLVSSSYNCDFFRTNPGLCKEYAVCASCCVCSGICADEKVLPTYFDCKACPIGTNKTSVGRETCSDCPSGQTSTNGLQCVAALTTSTTLVRTTSTTPAPTSTTPAPTSTTLARTTSTTPAPTSTTLARTTSTTPAPTSTTTVRTATTTPAPTNTPIMKTTSMTPIPTATTLSDLTSITTPVPTEDMPVSTTSSDILLIIGIVFSILVCCSFGLCLFILCKHDEKPK